MKLEMINNKVFLKYDCKVDEDMRIAWSSARRGAAAG